MCAFRFENGPKHEPLLKSDVHMFTCYIDLTIASRLTRAREDTYRGGRASRLHPAEGLTAFLGIPAGAQICLYDPVNLLAIHSFWTHPSTLNPTWIRSDPGPAGHCQLFSYPFQSPPLYLCPTTLFGTSSGLRGPRTYDLI